MAKIGETGVWGGFHVFLFLDFLGVKTGVLEIFLGGF